MSDFADIEELDRVYFPEIEHYIKNLADKVLAVNCVRHDNTQGKSSRVGKEPSRLGEHREPGGASQAEPTISDWRAERARVLARSLAQRANLRAGPEPSGGIGLAWLGRGSVARLAEPV